MGEVELLFMIKVSLFFLVMAGWEWSQCLGLVVYAYDRSQNLLKEKATVYYARTLHVFKIDSIVDMLTKGWNLEVT